MDKLPRFRHCQAAKGSKKTGVLVYCQVAGLWPIASVIRRCPVDDFARFSEKASGTYPRVPTARQVSVMEKTS
jgi:hypothetical protein